MKTIANKYSLEFDQEELQVINGSVLNAPVELKNKIARLEVRCGEYTDEELLYIASCLKKQINTAKEIVKGIEGLGLLVGSSDNLSADTISKPNLSSRQQVEKQSKNNWQPKEVEQKTYQKPKETEQKANKKPETNDNIDIEITPEMVKDKLSECVDKFFSGTLTKEDIDFLEEAKKKGYIRLPMLYR